MNKKALLSLCMLMSAFCVTFTSCSSEDDVIVVADNDAAVFNVTDADCSVVSVEFTNSGKYIITLRTQEDAAITRGCWPKSWKVGAATTRGEFGCWPKSWKTSAANTVSGDYTKSGDVYMLDGVGTVTIRDKGNGSVNIEIIGEDTYSFTAQKS